MTTGSTVSEIAALLHDEARRLGARYGAFAARCIAGNGRIITDYKSTIELML